MEKWLAITQTIREHFEQQVDFLQRLVQTKSANPFTPETSLPSLPVEEAVASLIQQELSTLGFKAELHGVTPQRPNVVCHVPGSGKAEKTLILTTHMDTV
jgi:acetylornithine deacetylase/succinyl-diaminopimelate desuccinylase-like protein